MLSNINSPLLTLFAFGLSIFLAGNFLGGALSRSQDTNKQIKAIQEQQKNFLDHLKIIQAAAYQRDSMILTQVDSLNAILFALDLKEGKIQGNLQMVKAGSARLREQERKIKEELAAKSKNSDFEFDQ